MNIIRIHHISLKNAIAGLVWAFKTQPNFKIHIALSLGAVIFGLILHISETEMLIIIFTIIIGMSAEMINTSIESMTDLISSSWHQQAKIAKDVSAGMMLITAMGAVLIALIIFVPKIINLITG